MRLKFQIISPATKPSLFICFKERVPYICKLLLDCASLIEVDG